MSSERVSVVIPAFRRPGTVADAIQSALGQTHPVDEVIVVDDASGDQTADMVRAIADPRVRLITLEINRGQSAATNIGIDAATGDVVALLDSDDVWLPDKTERQLAAWRAHPRRDETLFSSRVLLEEDGQVLGVSPRRTVRENEKLDIFLFVMNGVIQSSTFFGSRTLMAGVRFDETMRRHSDLTFLLRLMDRGGLVHQLNEPLIHWRSTSGAQRLSTTDKLDSSLQWFAKYEPLMSRRGAIAFRYRNHIRILRQHNPRAAALLTVQALALGVVRWEDLRRNFHKLTDRFVIRHAI